MDRIWDGWPQYQQQIFPGMSKFTNKLAVFSFIGSLLLLGSKNLSIFSFVVIPLITLIAYYLKKMWVQGKPNEWVLVIKNGKMVRSGIGLKTFVFPFETYICFPSRVQRVEFKAENITKENQGLQISGFAFWSVFRNNDGPFKCYKYMQGGDANANVKTMCQSVIRNQLANSTLLEALRNRNLIRDNMKRDLEAQLQGWGLWLQTVELTEVRICSKRLFEDLQAEYRQEVQSKALTFNLKTNERLTQLKSESEQKLSALRQNQQTQELIIKSNEMLKRNEEEASFDKKTYQLERRKIEKGKILQLAQAKKNQEVEIKRIEDELQLQRSRKAYELSQFKGKLKNLENHNDVSLDKYARDAADRVFGRCYRNVTIHQFTGDETGIAKLLPALQATALAIDK